MKDNVLNVVVSDFMSTCPVIWSVAAKQHAVINAFASADCLEKDIGDVDVMYNFIKDICQSRDDLEHRQAINMNRGRFVLLYFDEWICPGYVNFKLENLARFLYYLKDNEHTRRHGPAFCSDLTCYVLSGKYQKTYLDK